MKLIRRLEAHLIENMRPGIVIPLFYLVFGGLAMMFSAATVEKRSGTKASTMALLIAGSVCLVTAFGFAIFACAAKPIFLRWKRRRAARKRLQSHLGIDKVSSKIQTPFKKNERKKLPIFGRGRGKEPAVAAAETAVKE